MKGRRLVFQSESFNGLFEIFKSLKPDNIAEIREKIVKAGTRRVRPCLMTTATNILALIPVLTSTGIIQFYKRNGSQIQLDKGVFS